ncbi:uncharacterized protein LOC135209362 [Macrobrachium nipponense]|uniref:uncharacterized protein LOC135209362 n=1 Tax=Macrobrachium nipponense TaxID=159736 RepID=UPI0030C89C0F
MSNHSHTAATKNHLHLLSLSSSSTHETQEEEEEEKGEKEKKQKQYHCPVCNYASRRVSDVVRHTLVHLNEPQEPPLATQGQYHPFRAVGPSDFKPQPHYSHQVPPSPEKVFQTHHLGTHETQEEKGEEKGEKEKQQKQYHCPVCNYASRRKFNVVRHTRVHSNEPQDPPLATQGRYHPFRAIGPSYFKPQPHYSHKVPPSPEPQEPPTSDPQEPPGEAQGRYHLFRAVGPSDVEPQPHCSHKEPPSPKPRKPPGETQGPPTPEPQESPRETLGRYHLFRAFGPSDVEPQPHCSHQEPPSQDPQEPPLATQRRYHLLKAISPSNVEPQPHCSHQEPPSPVESLQLQQGEFLRSYAFSPWWYHTSGLSERAFQTHHLGTHETQEEEEGEEEKGEEEKKKKKNKKEYHCPHCPYKTVWKKTFKNHLNIHVPTRRFACSKCNATFDFKGALTRHFKSLHS